MPDMLELTPEETKFFTTQGAEVPPASEPATPEQAKRQEQPKSEAKTTAEPEVEAEKDEKSKTVPHGALHEERELRKAEKKRADEATEKFIKLQSRLDTLTEIAKAGLQQPKQEPAAPQIPDINTDPVGHFRALREQDRRELDALKSKLSEQESRGAQVNNVQRITQIAQAQEAEFVKANPDYNAASAHLLNLREAQLIAFGITDPAERANIRNQDAVTIATTALAQNRNPAQVVYEMAKASGYKPAETKSAETKPAAPSEAEKVKMAAKGQEAGQSLNQINGAANPPTTLESLLKMDEAEFAEATKGDKWRKLIGG